MATPRELRIPRAIPILLAMAVTGLPGTQVTYHRNGRPANNATFQIDASGVTTPTPFVRCVTIELSGMPRLRQGICS